MRIADDNDYESQIYEMIMTRNCSGLCWIISTIVDTSVLQSCATPDCLGPFSELCLIAVLCVELSVCLRGRKQIQDDVSIECRGCCCIDVPVVIFQVTRV